jgi:hypothetical protein
MSMFPNWTIQLHLNMLRFCVQRIDPLLARWQPEEADLPGDSQEELQERQE